MHKKAAIEMQFNWLFVLIIGAIILLLVGSLLFKQKEVSTQSKNALLTRNLDAILSGADASLNTVSVITLPQSKIEFQCDEYRVGTFSRKMEVMHVFTPTTLEGNKLITQTLEWSLPFRITNIVYLTSPAYRYMVIGQNQLAQEAFMLFPNETFTERSDSLGSVKSRGEQKIRLIFFDDSVANNKVVPIAFAKMADKDVTALKASGTLDNGDIEFFGKKGDRFVSLQSTSYFRKETLFGAMITDSPSLYVCTMENLFQKLGIVAEVYKIRTQQLIASYTQAGNKCSELRASAYSTAAIDILQKARFAKDYFSPLSSATSQLQRQNDQAQKQSCATIY